MADELDPTVPRRRWPGLAILPLLAVAGWWSAASTLQALNGTR